MRRSDLTGDCEHCAALCCVATSFEASADFAVDKPADVPCPHLRHDARCGIHESRRERGFRGCTLYDCYGAGQRATRLFAGNPHDTRERGEVFRTLCDVHELLWLLTQAALLCSGWDASLTADLAAEVRALEAIASSPASTLRDVDLAPRRRAGSVILRRVGDAVRARSGGARRLVVVAG